MAKNIQTISAGVQATGVTTAGATQYWSVGCGPSNAGATEVTRKITCRTAGTYSKLYVRVTANSTSSGSTLTFRKNGAATAMTVSIPTATIGVFEDTTNIVSVVAGDEIAFETVSGGTGTFTLAIASVIFETPINQDSTVRLVSRGYVIATASITHYHGVSGDRTAVTTNESSVESTIKKAGTAKNAYLYVAANARVTSTIVTLRKNRVDTAISFTIAAGVTGVFEDTSNTVSYSVDDEINWAITTSTGTQNMTLNFASLEYVTTDRQAFICAGNTNAGSTVSANLTRYFALGGAHKPEITEADVQMKAREAFTLSNFTVFLTVNSVSAASTFTLRKNGVDTSIVATATASTTGFYSDTTHTETVTASDELSIKCISGATGTSLGVASIMLWALAPPLAIVKSQATETVTVAEASMLKLKARLALLGTQTVTIAEDVQRIVTPVGGANITKTLATETVSIAETRGRIKASWRQQP